MKITVIGGGNMGGAVAVGAVKNKVVAGRDVVISDPRETLSETLGQGTEIRFTTDNASAVEGADLVVVAVKPWLMEQVLGGIAAKLDREKQAVVSIAAGVTFEKLNEYLSSSELGAIGLYRVIPNTAIALGQSATFIAKNGTTAGQDEMVLSLFDALGEVFEVEEGQMTAVTALSSSGIAYALRYMDAAVKGGVEMGLDAGESLKIVLQTMRGAITLLETNGTMLQTEIDKVTTPGGITLKGLEAMEQNGFSDAVLKGLLATK